MSRVAVMRTRRQRMEVQTKARMYLVLSPWQCLPTAPGTLDNECVMGAIFYRVMHGIRGNIGTYNYHIIDMIYITILHNNLSFGS